MLKIQKYFLIIGAILCLGTILLPIVNFNQIPNYIPVHWGALGEATIVIEKNLLSFIIGPIIQLAILIGVVYLTGKEKNHDKSLYLIGVGLQIILIFLLTQAFKVFGIQSITPLFNLLAIILLGWILIGAACIQRKFHR